MNKAIIFDFDGTLVDSEKAIYHCYQTVTKELAPNRVGYAKNILIGPPLRDTASEILGPIHQNQLDEFVKKFIKMHDSHSIFYTQPYVGIDKLLKKLALMNIPMAIATNKREAPTIKLIERFGWSSFFNSIQCSDSQLNLRNKDEMIQCIINANNIFVNSYFVGDTVNDGVSANLNKLKFIQACYGYGLEQDWSNVKISLSVKDPLELETIFI